MKSVLKTDVSSAAYVSMYPYLLLACVNIFGSYLADYIMNKGFKKNIIRNIYYLLGVFGAATFLMSSVYYYYYSIEFFKKYNFMCIIYDIISRIIWFCYSWVYIINNSYSPNILEISPRYGGILLGIANTVGSLHIFYNYK